MDKKAEQRASTFIISLILIGMIVGIISLSLSEIGNKYTDVTYDQTNMDTYDKMDELYDMADETKTSVEDLKETSGALDILGSLVSNAVNSAKITFKSFDITDDIISESFKQAPFGQAGSILRQGLATILMVFLVISVFISAIIKWKF